MNDLPHPAAPTADGLRSRDHRLDFPAEFPNN